MSELQLTEHILERMVRAVERVRDRLSRATSSLDAAGVPYAVVGGNAVAAWVATVDEAAVRNTQDVNLLIRRTDLETVKIVLATAGFIFRHVKGIDMFLDGPGAKARDAVHILFAGEKVDQGQRAFADVELETTVRQQSVAGPGAAADVRWVSPAERRQWIVVFGVDRVVRGRFEEPQIRFLVHSPSVDLGVTQGCQHVVLRRRNGEWQRP
jgi:hypothetical protein